MFIGLTAAICEKAWQITKPTLLTAAEMEVTNKYAGTIVVLDPATGEILFRARINVSHPDSAKYDEFAFEKARVSWETGLPSRIVQQEAPYLYKPGHIKWGGSAVENDLAVGFSGVQAVYDEAVSWTELKWIKAICQDEMTKPDGVMASQNPFIPVGTRRGRPIGE